MASETKVDYKVLDATVKKVLAHKPKKKANSEQRAVRDSNPRTGGSAPAT